MPHPTADPVADLDFVVLARRLLAFMRAERANVGTALDALVHAYVAIVRENDTIAGPAARSLRSAANACTIPTDADVRIVALSRDSAAPHIH